MAKFYAHSNFVTDQNEWGQATKTVKTGDEVTMQKLGVNKEQWDEWLELGLVSEEPYPDIPDYMSPAEYHRQNAQAAAAHSAAEEIRYEPAVLPATANPAPPDDEDEE